MTRSLAEAQAALVELGGPVAIKGQSRRLPHKSDAGAVLLNLDSPASLSAAWEKLHDNVSRYDGAVELEGVLVEKMSAKALELIIGGRNDPYWGPTLLVGLGGVQAELTHDFRLLPGDAGPEDIRAELDRLKAAPLLHGYRGSAKLDLDAVIQIMLRIGALLRGEADIKEIDLNPVFVYPAGQGAVALDALIVTA
jgi:acyl-CoA synthetase (NDP forming)